MYAKQHPYSFAHLVGDHHRHAPGPSWMNPVRSHVRMALPYLAAVECDVDTRAGMVR